jgi:hypothetical protein
MTDDALYDLDNYQVRDTTHLGLPTRSRSKSGGRKALPPSQRKVTVQACILPAQLEWLATYGEGNISLGLRRLIAKGMQEQARTPVLPPNEVPPVSTTDAFD